MAGLHNVEAAVKALETQWFAAEHEARLACGQLVIEAIQKLIPNYVQSLLAVFLLRE